MRDGLRRSRHARYVSRVTSPSLLRLTNLPARPGASEPAIAAAEQAIGRSLPDDYRAFLRESNGIEGLVGEAYLMLWPVEELGTLNADARTYVPGLVLVGGDGGGEALGFLETNRGTRYVQVPFSGMSADATEDLGATLADVATLLHSRGWSRSHAYLTGELSPWPARERLLAVLREGGLHVVEDGHTLHVADAFRWTFDHVSVDGAEPEVEADAETVEMLLRDAERVSTALARAKIRHRFEVFDGDRVPRGYFHFDWPQPTAHPR